MPALQGRAGRRGARRAAVGKYGLATDGIVGPLTWNALIVHEK
jgi:peptidoglycan hydrolase-like protein with peptidoglycan-binding domain